MPCVTASVLVIEYGYLVDGDDAVLVPGLLNNTRYVYNITSVPQQGLNNNTFTVPAGAVVGGGSAVNGMFFDRGSAPDYDAWVKLGNPGWGWKDLLPYFKKVTSHSPLCTFLSSVERKIYSIPSAGLFGRL